MTTFLIIFVIVLLITLGAILILFHRQGLRLNEEIHHVIESEEIKAEFLAEVSNNFRGPLDSIIGRCETIERQPCFKEHPQVVEAIEDIRFQSQQLSQYARELMEISNTQGNIPKSAKIQVNLVELIMSYRREILHEIQDNIQVYIRTELSPHTKVWLNTTLFRQFIMHLLRAASHNTDAGYISITYATENSGLRFWIENTGQPIPQDAANILLGKQPDDDNPEDENANKETIISLAICKNIIDKLKGTIEILPPKENQENINLITFWFPCSVKNY
ncbi:MAG: HAMP domain-containing histidine kinase [Bacteroidaceae bacterium]|nr:HAMP domain-containing histidine kinase [Bacteroidaceae bacterium]